jgi:large subunit ribosomal protein L15
MPVLERIKHPSNLKRRHRKGRGISSGWGKTSGRGQTGQKSRVKAIHPRVEGGQNPMIRHLPKYAGFKVHSRINYYPVNLEKFAEAADGTVVDLIYLAEHGLLPKKLRGLYVKLLGDGECASKITFKLHAYSHRAKAKVEAAGGTCEVIE